MLVFVNCAPDPLVEAMRDVAAAFPEAAVEVVEGPAPRPFCRAARDLLARLRAGGPIDAFVVAVDGVGIDSARARLLGLRLGAARYLLLPSATTGWAAARGRLAFARSLVAILAAKLVRRATFLDQSLALLLAWAARALVRRAGAPRAPPPTADAPPRVLHVVPSLGAGGAERQLVALLRGRSEAFSHAVLALHSRTRFFEAEIRGAGVPVAFLDERAGRFAALLAAALPATGQILALARRLREDRPPPDIVHCWVLAANVIGSIAGRLAGLPAVITSVRSIHSNVRLNHYPPRWQRPLERATAPLCTATVANSPSAARDYEAFALARPGRVHVIENGIDARAVRRRSPEERAAIRAGLGIPEGAPVLGTVARLSIEKDIATLVRAVAAVRRALPDARGLVVGEGPLRGDLERLARDLGVADAVRFLGERADAGELIQVFDVFVLSSLIEGLPNAVMESQLLGTPVVSTAAGGAVDLVRDGETGLLAPVGDAEALARAAVRLLRESDLRAQIVAAARARAETFTIQRLVERTEALYRRALGGAGP